jgi:hypothetical protein
MPYKQEFFGSFLQKRTACFLLFAASTGRLWQESLSSQPGISSVPIAQIK